MMYISFHATLFARVFVHPALKKMYKLIFFLQKIYYKY